MKLKSIQLNFVLLDTSGDGGFDRARVVAQILVSDEVSI